MKPNNTNDAPPNALRPKAVLTIVVEYDATSLDDLDDIKAYVDNFNGEGRVVKADLFIPANITMDMRN